MGKDALIVKKNRGNLKSTPGQPCPACARLSGSTSKNARTARRECARKVEFARRYARVTRVICYKERYI